MWPEKSHVKYTDGRTCNCPDCLKARVNEIVKEGDAIRIKTLDEICVECGTDKASVHPVKGHGYAFHYEKWFSPVRCSAVKLLEIGVGGGESIRAWLEYFGDTKIFGVDIVQNTNIYNTRSCNSTKYTFTHGIQESEVFWQCFIADHGKDWDIIIDDGGHFNNQVVTSFKCLWPVLKSGGLYCIEDLGVSYGAGSIFLTPGWPNHMDFIKDMLDQINHGDEIESLYFAKELAIIRKK